MKLKAKTIKMMNKKDNSFKKMKVRHWDDLIIAIIVILIVCLCICGVIRNIKSFFDVSQFCDNACLIRNSSYTEIVEFKTINDIKLCICKDKTILPIMKMPD